MINMHDTKLVYLMKVTLARDFLGTNLEELPNTYTEEVGTFQQIFELLQEHLEQLYHFLHVFYK